MEEDNVKCENCGWVGHDSELWCSKEDADRPLKCIKEIDFYLCPNCESDDIVDYEERE